MMLFCSFEHQKKEREHCSILLYSNKNFNLQQFSPLIHEIIFSFWVLLKSSETSFCDIFLFSSMQVVLLDDGTTLVSRLILDVMGNSSPIVRQVGFQCLKNVFFISGL
jgi:hypothetical protein